MFCRQVVDLMWGLTNDRLQADRDLMAMKVREIFRCQAMSLGPSFVVRKFASLNLFSQSIVIYLAVNELFWLWKKNGWYFFGL